VQAVPTLRATAKKYAAQGLVVIAPSQDAEAQVKKFKARKQIEEYVLVADTQATAASYGVDSFPTLFVVGKDGKVLWKSQSMGPVMSQAIEAALAAKAPATKSDPAKAGTGKAEPAKK
jgi:peroxiredoxin